MLLRDNEYNVEALLVEVCNKNQEISQLKEQITALQGVVNAKDAELRNIRSNRVFKMLSATYRNLTRVRVKLQILKNKLVSRTKRELVLDKNDNPLVSIIVPVYNNYDYLRICFDSILHQTYKNVEIIAVDDCSTDIRVHDLLNEYSENPKFYFYRNTTNSGISITTNNAIKKANGVWFAFVDCDDWLDLQAIEKMIETLRNKPGSVFGYSNRFNYNNFTQELVEIDFKCRPTKDYYDNLQLGMYTSHLKVIHKTVFSRIGLFEDKYKGTQDYDFSLKAAFYLGDTAFAYLPEPIYFHRIHDTQTTQQHNDLMLRQTDLLRGIALKRKAIADGSFNKSISFIILSLNKMHQTLACIQSIERTVKVKHDIILLDNHSTSETIKFIKKNIEPMENVTVLYENENLGPARGRKKAIEYATGDYFVFLDNDIVVQENWLPELIIRMENNENVGAVSCKVIFPDDSVQFNSMKYYIDLPYITFTLTGFRQHKDDMCTCDYEENDWVPAGATLYKSEVFKQLEGLEEYPNTYEDNEAGFQLKKLGYKILNSPASIVVHHHFSYVELRNGKKEYLAARYNEENLIKSSLIFYKRNKLIVKDEFVLNKMGLIGKSKDQVVKEFEERVMHL